MSFHLRFDIIRGTNCQCLTNFYVFEIRGVLHQSAETSLRDGYITSEEDTLIGFDAADRFFGSGDS
jgi:hypothetical protein